MTVECGQKRVNSARRCPFANNTFQLALLPPPPRLEKALSMRPNVVLMPCQAPDNLLSRFNIIVPEGFQGPPSSWGVYYRAGRGAYERHPKAYTELRARQCAYCNSGLRGSAKSGFWSAGSPEDATASAATNSAATGLGAARAATRHGQPKELQG